MLDTIYLCEDHGAYPDVTYVFANLYNLAIVNDSETTFVKREFGVRKIAPENFISCSKNSSKIARP